MAKERRRFRRARQQVQDREGNALYALGEGRRPRHHPVLLREEPEHRRAQALGAPRRQRGVPQSRRLAHLERLLCDGDSAGQEPSPAPAALRRNGHGALRPRLDHGVERCRRPHHLRMGAGRAVRHPAQLPSPALQRLRARAGALRRRHQRAADHQSLRRPRFHLQHQIRLQGPLRRRAGLFFLQGRAEGISADDEFRARRRQHSADHGDGARRRRRPSSASTWPRAR